MNDKYYGKLLQMFISNWLESLLFIITTNAG